MPIWQGSFTFQNSSTSAVEAAKTLESGRVTCPRDDSWGWWRQNVNDLWLIALVPMFSVLLSLWNLQPMRSRQFPAMVVISCIGFLTNRLANTCTHAFYLLVYMVLTLTMFRYFQSFGCGVVHWRLHNRRSWQLVQSTFQRYSIYR